MIARIRTLVLATVCLLMIALAATAQEGRLITEWFHAPSLEGNLFNDPTDRTVTIYLPPSYDTEPERVYPVVYLVHGYVISINTPLQNRANTGSPPELRNYR